ncbi:hypothetical protein JVU11DRAFT_7030 [Chiua virens]|nr:hypothetical protein JVU11DRAFT_7030 [Chiua virens]
MLPCQVLNELVKYWDKETGEFIADQFKIVYITSMKALMQEIVASFTSHLTATFSVKVGDLISDSQMMKQQISETQIIITTGMSSLARALTPAIHMNLVWLMIIDKHGPIIKSVITHTIQRMKQTSDDIQLVGLSTMLPYYQDVAMFLQVDKSKGLFYFNTLYRPCGLQQQFISVTEKKAIRHFQVMNEVYYEKLLHQARKNQALVFVQPCKETTRTAKFIYNMASEKETINHSSFELTVPLVRFFEG